MTGIDQFESAFRASLHEPFHLTPLAPEDVLFITDAEVARDGEDSAEELARALLPESRTWQRLELAPGTPLAGLLEAVSQAAPDLVVTHRGLGSPSWRQPYTVGENLEVLTLVAAPPVLALPHPGLARPAAVAPSCVLAISDRLAGDHDLVNAALALTPDSARLVLAHLEDSPSFDRFMEAISKIPAIDTETARDTILARLLKEQRDFAQDARGAICADQPHPEVEVLVDLGGRMHDCLELVAAKQASLVVLNTRDEDQLAMHGLSHALAVELSALPLLLL